MHVVLLEEALTPGGAELGRPLAAVPLPRETRHLVDLPVEDRQLVRGAALIAVAAEAVAQRQLHDVAVRRPDEAGGGDALASELLQRFERAAQGRPHEGPAQAPVLEVNGHARSAAREASTISTTRPRPRADPCG